jgi:ubiquinol-cytochrome c reductase cytochrome b subunit
MSIPNNDHSLSHSKNLVEESWNQYLAGLIDGDGYLGISNKGFACLEITMDIYDEYALNKVKQKLGGSVKLRSGARAFRYRLHHKTGILVLLHRINGYIQNSKRIPQLEKMCNLYEIPYKDPVKIKRDNSWFAGFFDADGTIGYSIKKGWPQLTISVSNKKEIDLMPFKEVFGGFCRLDKASNTYKWDIYSTEAVSDFCEYLREHPLHSRKKQRIFLVKRFYELRDCRAYKEDPNSLLFKAWVQFEKDWNTL